jgi:ATP-dependent DNA helicase RecG
LKGLGLKDRQIDAVFYTKQYGEITNSKYQEVADVSKPTATKDINELVKKDVFNKSGTKGSSAVYRLKIGS